MKETQPCNENSFPWHMIDSKWNAVARDSDYTSWLLYKEKPSYNGTTGLWHANVWGEYATITKDAQEVIGVDMSKWNDIPWGESLMLRPGCQEKTEESNCDKVISEEEVDHLVNSVKEYPVVKMKELRNYAIGDVVRLKKTGELVEIDNYLGCRSCVLYEQYCRNQDSCPVKTGCYGEGKAFGGKSVHFKLVKE